MYDGNDKLCGQQILVLRDELYDDMMYEAVLKQYIYPLERPVTRPLKKP